VQAGQVAASYAGGAGEAGCTVIGFLVESYDDDAKRWLGASGHYLQNPPPGALFCVVARQCAPDLFGVERPSGARVGMCLVGRPVARMLPQDGTWGEVTRLVLVDGLPHGTASALLRFVFDAARRRGLSTVISYHDRSRHTGCIYRKAGMRKDGATTPTGKGWASRHRPMSGDVGKTSKRRWRIDLTEKP
jgi:hypothetical protein